MSLARAARGKDLKLEKAGELRVPVSPPSSEQPEGIVSHWHWGRGDDKRTHYYRQPPPMQPLRVYYEITVDQAFLERIAERSRQNRNGKSVRGPVVAMYGRITNLGLSPTYVNSMVRRAANNRDHTTTDGPLHIKVKLLEQPTPVPATCSRCARPALEHTRQEEILSGGYRESEHGRVWDHTMTHVEVRWWCPPVKETSR